MDDDRPLTETIASSLERTRAAARARIELSIDHSWETRPAPKRQGRRPSRLRRLAGMLVWAAGKRAFKALTRGLDPRHLVARGVIDLGRRRVMVDFGAYAESYADGEKWGGTPGQPIAESPPSDQDRPTALWLLDILAGVTDATAAGAEDVRGTPCRRYEATVDIGRASQRTPNGVAVPELGRFEELLAFPVEVCVDDAHVRRVRARFAQRTETIELWDVGAALDDVDWSRLPTLRTPR